MNRQLLVLILVMGLVLLTGIQAFQVNELKDSVNSGEVGYSNSNGDSVGSYPQQNNAPAMVGGC